MKKTFFFIISFFIIIQYSCKKERSSGEEDLVIVSGKVWDNTLNEPVSNLLVFISKNSCVNFSCNNSKRVDSTRTDKNGFYKITHEYDPFLSISCDYGKTYANAGSFQLSKSGTYLDKNFTLRKTSILRARVIVKNNLYPPLIINNNIDIIPSQIYGSDKDTVVYFRGFANFVNVIDLLVRSPNLSYYRRKIDYINLGNYADTLDITINADPDNFPIKKQ